ncbi:MAG: heavy metal translocating P-type ATPase [Acidimicrobiales bacterium]
MTLTAGRLAPGEVSLAVGGMTCGACAARIERRLNRLDGVAARVNFATERASVTLDASVPVERLLDEIAALGYSAQETTTGTGAADAGGDVDDRARYLWRRLLVALALFMPLGDLSVAFWLAPVLRFPGWQILLLALAAPVVGWAAWPFYQAALRGARHRATSMDTLVSIGILASTVWSIYAMFWQDRGRDSAQSALSTHSLLWVLGHGSVGGIYLDIAAGVTTFLLAGRYFEAKARGRAGDALRSLAALGAKDVAVLRVDGSEVRRTVSELAVGDRFVVRPGEAIATDGEVLAGTSAVDRTAMTGESLPLDVQSGDEVIGGAVVLSGRLTVRATRVGADTQLAQMIRLVEEAQNQKAAAQRLADRISAVFVPVVLVVAVATLTGWLLSGHSTGRAVDVALSVLIIACPCALGLATPAALTVASGEGARQGIFFKGYQALERSRHIDTIVLDKTGTLTEGRMQVVDVAAADGTEAGMVLSWAAALEHHSAHPIARAIVAAAGAWSDTTRHALDASTQRGEVQDPGGEVEALPGEGLRGVVDGHVITVGRTALVSTEALALAGTLAARQADWDRQGHTTVVVSQDGVPIGAIALADTLRPTATEAVQALVALGLRCVLVSGDRSAAVQSVASALGIREVVAEALPADKVNIVRQLQEQGCTVAVVGDGINDGPALAASDLGLAVGSGTDVAINAADLIIVRDDLAVVASAVQLARRTLRTIRGNLFWAFGYNIVALPLAAAGLLNPLIAGAAMAFSSAFVMANSARIRQSRSLVTEDRIARLLDPDDQADDPLPLVPLPG